MKQEAVPPKDPHKKTHLPRGREARQREESFWVQRHDTRRDLRKIWNLIANQPTRRKGRGRRCDHVSNGQRCSYLCISSSTQRAPIPLRCRFHLATMLAGGLAALLKGDPEAITEDFAVGCLGLLVDERLRGGPTAREAQEALGGICDALLAWPSAAQRQQSEGR